MGLGVRRRKGTWRSEGGRGPALCGLLLRDPKRGGRIGHCHTPRVGRVPPASALATSLSPLLPLANRLQLGDLPPSSGPTFGVVFDPPLSLLSVVTSEAAQPLSTGRGTLRKRPRCGGMGCWDQPGTRAGGHATA